MKKAIVLIVSIIIVLIIGFLIIKNNQKDETPMPRQVEETVVEGIKISNATVNYENNTSTFTATITNTKEEPVELGIIDIIFKDENGNEIVTLKGLIDKKIDSNFSELINASTNIDITNYKTIEYKL